MFGLKAKRARSSHSPALQSACWPASFCIFVCLARLLAHVRGEQRSAPLCRVALPDPPMELLLAQVVDKSLEDIKYNLAPAFDQDFPHSARFPWAPSRRALLPRHPASAQRRPWKVWFGEACGKLPGVLACVCRKTWTARPARRTRSPSALRPQPLADEVFGRRRNPPTCRVCLTSSFFCFASLPTLGGSCCISLGLRHSTRVRRACHRDTNHEASFASSPELCPTPTHTGFGGASVQARLRRMPPTAGPVAPILAHSRARRGAIVGRSWMCRIGCSLAPHLRLGFGGVAGSCARTRKRGRPQGRLHATACNALAGF